jgi:xylulokinase
LTERLGAEEILHRCGAPLTSQAVGPKLAWLARNEPECWARTRQLLMAHSFLARRLTGEYALDHVAASQCVPLYDLREQRWIEEWAAEVAPGLPLPRLVWPGEAVGPVTAAAAAETGLPAGTPVAAGTWSCTGRRWSWSRSSTAPASTRSSGPRSASCPARSTWRPGWRPRAR